MTTYLRSAFSAVAAITNSASTIKTPIQAIVASSMVNDITARMICPNSQGGANG